MVRGELLAHVRLLPRVPMAIQGSVIVRELGDAAGTPHLTCHTIRRSMATHLLGAGASPLEVSGILGHSDLKSLSRYVRVAQREVKETHEKTHPRELL